MKCLIVAYLRISVFLFDVQVVDSLEPIQLRLSLFLFYFDKLLLLQQCALRLGLSRCCSEVALRDRYVLIVIGRRGRPSCEPLTHIILVGSERPLDKS